MANFTFATYPEGMSLEEAQAYIDRAKRKYGESNVRKVNILLHGDTVEIVATLKEGCRERIRRLSPEEVKNLTAVKIFSEGERAKG